MRKKTIGVLFGILGSVVLSFAQTLTFKECLQRAAEKSYPAQAASFEHKAKVNAFWQESAQALPILATDMGFERHLLPSYGFSQRWTFLRTDWALGRLIFKPFKKAGKEAQAAEQMVRWNRLVAMEKAATYFIAILQNEKERYLLNERLHLLELHRQVARALWQAGSKTELDVLQTQAEIWRLNENLRTAIEKEQRLEGELRLILQLNRGDSLQLMALNTEQICNQPLPALSEKEWNKNPQLRAMQLRIEAQKWAINAVKAKQTPHLQVTGGFFWDQDPTGDGNYWLVGAGVSFPLFQWRISHYQKQEAQMVKLKLENQNSALKQELQIELLKILNHLKSLRKIMRLQAKRQKTEAQAFAIAQANYKAGLITNLEYLDTQQRLTTIKIQRQKTRLDYALQLVHYYLLTDQVQALFEIVH